MFAIARKAAEKTSKSFFLLKCKIYTVFDTVTNDAASLVYRVKYATADNKVSVSNPGSGQKVLLSSSNYRNA